MLLLVLEEWRPVHGFGEGYYEVSSLGRVRRVAPGRNGRTTGNILRPGKSPQGYRQVYLSVGGVKKMRTVHSLVAEAFLPPPEQAGMTVDHDDENKENNAASNLIWKTQGDNVRTYFRNHPRSPRRGVGRANAVLTDDDARSIVRDYAAGGVTHRDLSRRYGCHHARIADIVNAKAWTHATGLTAPIRPGPAAPPIDIPGERWKPMPCDCHEISTHARIRRTRHAPGRRGGHILKPTPHPVSKLLTVHLHKTTVYLHRAVADAYLQPPRTPCDLVWLNGIKMDCRAENLEWRATTRGTFAPYGNDGPTTSKPLHPFDRL